MKHRDISDELDRVYDSIARRKLGYDAQMVAQRMKGRACHSSADDA